AGGDDGVEVVAVQVVGLGGAGGVLVDHRHGAPGGADVVARAAGAVRSHRLLVQRPDVVGGLAGALAVGALLLDQFAPGTVGHGDGSAARADGQRLVVRAPGDGAPVAGELVAVGV